MNQLLLSWVINMLASRIADELGYELLGEDFEIEGIAWCNSASANEIAVIRDKRELQNTKAKVVLSKPIITQTEKTLLITYENIECSLVKVCNSLINNGIWLDYSTPTKYKVTDRGFYVGEHCKISENAIIQPGAKIGDYVTICSECIIEPDVFVGSGTIIEKGVRIGSGSKIGISSFYHYYDDGQIKQFDGCGIVRIGKGTVVGCNTTIQRGTLADTIIGANNMIGNCIDIGHDVIIGDNCKIVSQTGIASDVTILNNVTIFGQAGVSNGVVIGNNVVVKGKSIVTKSVPDDVVIYGPFGRTYSEEMKLVAKVRKFFDRKDE